MKDKDLALALNFGNAPQNVKKEAELHSVNYQRLEKAEAQIELWSKELQDAKKAFGESSKSFRKAINEWTSPAKPEKEELAKGGK